MKRIERELRDLGDTVAVVVLMDTAALFGQVSMNKILRYTRVWGKRGTEWRLVVAHISEAVPGVSTQSP